MNKNIPLYFNFCLLGALTLFGTYFSKFQLFNNLYLHDVALLCGALLSLIIQPKLFPTRIIMLVLAISAIYLTVSLNTKTVSIALILRQFALFGYMGCYYLLNRNNNEITARKAIETFIIVQAVVAIALQLSTVAFFWMEGSFNPLNVHYHYWITPPVVVGLISASAIVLIYVERIWISLLLWLSVFALCWTTGHASAQLASISVLFFFFLNKLPGWLKVVPIAVGVVITCLLLVFAPQFNDSNKAWRLLIWKHHLTDLITDKYGVLGNGFGVPYMSRELELYLYQEISSTALQEAGKPDERYLSPPHNSFITIFFAIGILPGLLVFVPYRKLIEQIFQPQSDKSFILLMLSIVGLTVWCSFNVVLELPHCAGFFWLVYFSFWNRSGDRLAK